MGSINSQFFGLGKNRENEEDAKETSDRKINPKRAAYRHSTTTHFKNNETNDLIKEADTISATLEEESQEDASKGPWEASNSFTEMKSKYSNSHQNNPSSPPSKDQNIENIPKSAENEPKCLKSPENVQNSRNQPLLAPKSLLCLPSLVQFGQFTGRTLAVQAENPLKSQTQPHEFPKITNPGLHEMT